MRILISITLLFAAACGVLKADELGLIKRDGWSFDRSQLNFYDQAKPEEQKARGELKQVAGWTEFDFEISEAGWYELWEKGWNPEWTRTVSLDGEAILRHTISAPEDSDKKYGGFKEANLWLSKGKHALRFHRVTWPGDLPDAWELRAANGNPASSLRAMAGENIVRVGDPLSVKLIGGTKTPVSYEFFLNDAETGEKFPVGTLEFPASDQPVERPLTFSCPRQGSFFLQATSQGATLRPADVKYGMIVAVDTKNAPVPPKELVTTPVVEIDCAAEPPAGAFWEKDGKSRVVKAPFGSYRESSGLGRGVDGYWGTDGFSYKVKLPVVDRLYRLRVEYPDDDRRSMGFWINDGSEPKSNAAAIVNSGGVETGDQYKLTHGMQVHESFFYPQGKDEVIVAVVNLVPSLKAAAAKIRIDLVESGLPAAPLGDTRERVLGYYFEESGRWRKFFGGDHRKGILEDLKTLERWGQWNRYFGANLMFPTINVYQANHYPSRILDGYFSRPFNEVRLASLVAEKYGQKFVPEFHLTGQDWFDREVMGVWEEKSVIGGKPVSRVMFASPEVEETIIRDRDGNTKYSYEPFVYNALHPKVQEKYLAIIGELADALADSPAFDGISSRMMFTWQWQGWNALPNLSWGYDDWTVAAFQKETGITIPGEAGSAKRFRERYLFLTGPERDRWIEWRCRKIHEYHQRLLARIQQARPGTKLVFNWFPLDERHALSTDMREQMMEVGMDWKTYAKEKDIVVIPPAATYGRRYSIPTSDASKVDGLYDPAMEAVGRFAGRAYGVYSDYYEVNRNMNWAELGGRPFPAFDAALPSGVHERGIYAQAMADCDTGFLSNGGSGWIFGTPTRLQPFMREFRSLPAVPFTPWEKGRDPVAVWSHRESNGTFWFYAVNRLPVPVKSDLTLSGGEVTPAPGGPVVALKNGKTLSLDLEPFMMKAFRAGKNTELLEIRNVVPKDYVDSIVPMLVFAERVNEDLALGRIAPELSLSQAGDAQECFREARKAFDKGEYFRARGLLERLAAVQVYYLAGKYPPGLWQRSENHGVKDVSVPSGVVPVIGARGKIPEAVADVAVDALGNLWVAGEDRLLQVDRDGKPVRSFPLFEPHDLIVGDIRKATLAPPKTFSPDMISIAPDGTLVGKAMGGLTFRFDTRVGRLIDWPYKTLLAPGTPSIFLAVTPMGDLLISSGVAGWQGVYLYSGDGLFKAKLSDREATCGAVDDQGRIYLGSSKGIAVLSASGAEVEQKDLSGVSRLAVSADGKMVLALDSKNGLVTFFERGQDGKLAQRWSQPLPGVSSIAFGRDGKVVAGCRVPREGALVQRFTLGKGGLEGGTAILKAVAEVESLTGATRLKAFDGSLYYAAHGKLMRILPGKIDKVELAFDPKFSEGRSAFEAFAFAPNGDLYLISNWNGKARGVNAFVCKREGNGWASPQALNAGKPLWDDSSVLAADLDVDAKGSLILRLKNDGAKGQNVSIYRWSEGGKKELLADFGDVSRDLDWGIARRGGDVVVTGGSPRKILKINEAGAIVWTLERQKSSPPGYADLRSPGALAIDGKGRIWAADPTRNQILEISADGKFRGALEIGGNAKERDSLNQPSGVAVVKDASGTEWLYVADAGNRRIVKWPIAK